MRVMVIVKANQDSEAGVMPSDKQLAEMGQFNEELVQAGMILAGEGLHPTSKAKRVRSQKGKVSVIDGPFPETKELIAGFWIWKVSSMEDAIAWAKRIPDLAERGADVEIRPIFEVEDFAPTMTPELQAQEVRLRAEVEQQVAQSSEQSVHTSSNMFVNLPVKDLNRSVEFFKNLGYTFNLQFTNEDATCMVVNERIFVMLLVEKFFQTFTSKPLADAKQNTEAIVALSLPSRAAVDKIVQAALNAGAAHHRDPVDHGFMYQWGFEDLDGHIWEYFWMNPDHVQPQ